MPFVFFDPLYLILVGPTILLAIWAQIQVKSAFAKYKQVPNSSNMTGAEAAARMLHGEGLQIVGSSGEASGMNRAVAIMPTRGMLSDHYDPKAKTLRLSPDVYNGRSLAAVGIACHEAGHALQDAHGYALLGMRTALVPLASIGSWMSFPIILLGAILRSPNLLGIGIIAFALIVLFQLITLPVEFNASSRAKKALANLGVIRGQSEINGVASVLNAAAMTYVAAAASAAMTLLYYVMIFTGSRR